MSHVIRTHTSVTSLLRHGTRPRTAILGNATAISASAVVAILRCHFVPDCVLPPFPPRRGGFLRGAPCSGAGLRPLLPALLSPLLLRRR